MDDFDGSQVLYRLAFASGMRAAQRQSEAMERGGDPERMARSYDARLEAVILIQASAETWINRLYETNGLHARGGGWRARWNGIGAVAEAMGRPKRSISGEHARVLDEIDTVRNFVVHGDQSSRSRFDLWSRGQGLYEILTVEYVGALFQRVADLWMVAGEITGQPTPFSGGAWVASDEFR